MTGKESIRHEVEPLVDSAVDKIYNQNWKVQDAFDWLLGEVKNNYKNIKTIDYALSSLDILDFMYPKLKTHEKNILAWKIPIGDTYD
ncbi:MAG: hypothetical protein JXA38_06075 [Methanosarcinaceae archaeon]|nr:hypothetical protein [Methanosarcinaceae archaeon]